MNRGSRVSAKPLTIVAEQRGFPPAEQLSLAHRSTKYVAKSYALCLGMQLLLITQQLDKDKEFCGLIKIPVGENALDGCLIGYADMKPPLPKRPILNEVTNG